MMSHETTSNFEQKRIAQYTLFTLIGLLCVRLLSMYFMPLNDSTEARYGEIARVMLQSGNWVTLFQDGAPFWAKPPLSTWLSAVSMRVFGVNEIAARMPSLLLSLGVLWLVFDLARRRMNDSAAWMTVLVLAGSLFFFIDAGSVMTDPALLFCTTLILISCWRALHESSAYWGYAFFVGVGLGLLAKGPIAVVLTGLPIFFWTLLHRKWQMLWTRLPWFSGVVLTFVIALPWYILAEKRTPGFLNYFVVGEHIQRFINPGWSGDKYGFAHRSPMGMIWVYALAGLLPWLFFVLVYICRYFKQLPNFCGDKDGWASYLILAMLLPLIFFTFSGNIIYTYVFPILPFFALFFVNMAHKTQRLTYKNQLQWIFCANGVSVIFIVVTALFILSPKWVEKSQTRVVSQWKKQCPPVHSKLIYWANKNDYSAQFYTKGQVVATLNPETLCQWIVNQPISYVAVRENIMQSIPDAIRSHLTKVASIPMLHNNYQLFRADPHNLNLCTC